MSLIGTKLHRVALDESSRIRGRLGDSSRSRSLIDLLAVERAGFICCPYAQVAVQFNHLMIDSAVRLTL